MSVRQKIDQSVKKAAIKYRLPSQLIKGVIEAESNFQVSATSPKGAQGLMQLMPETAQELGIDNPFDIDQNIDGGARYLRKMLDLFGGDIKLALAAYNAGPGAVERHKGIPPYLETRRYVDRVVKLARRKA
jgi:soluble lytic murein transglycosylase-like protein